MLISTVKTINDILHLRLHLIFIFVIVQHILAHLIIYFAVLAQKFVEGVLAADGDAIVFHSRRALHH